MSLTFEVVWLLEASDLRSTGWYVISSDYFFLFMIYENWGSTASDAFLGLKAGDFLPFFFFGGD